MSVFAITFIGVAIVMGVGATSMGAGIMAVVPFGMALVGVFFFLTAVRKQTRLASAPQERLPVRIMDERTSRSEKSTSYYATLQKEDGDRFEVPVDARTASEIAPGDMGIAYMKGGIMLHFERVPV